ncbi:MAG TPA: flagellar biosynthesis anti-sigma factor FlgM [Holophaga sp.]|nr:flagellar biosynthesis anti-sigma factor FlgM [Holophaga sp.]
MSGTASLVAVARAGIAGIPDVRIEKVEAIRAQMEADSYHPDGEAVADGIIRDHTPPRRDP